MTVVIVQPQKVPIFAPRPLEGELEIVADTVTAVFTSECRQYALEIERFVPVTVLANLIVEFTMRQPSSHKERTAYVSIVMDDLLVTTGWNSNLAQFLSAYSPLNDFDPAFATVPIEVRFSIEVEDSPPLLLPCQLAGAEALAYRRGSMVHTDPMDTMIVVDGSPISYSRDGYVMNSNLPLALVAPPKATLAIRGCLLTELTGTGKTRTALEALRRILAMNAPRVPPPRGRTAVNAVAIVVPPHTVLSSWVKEIEMCFGTMYRVLCVYDARSLVGLAEKIKDVDMVLFNENVFTTNKKMTTAFCASSLNQAKWTKDYEVFWKMWWPAVVLDEVHRYAEFTRPAVLKKDMCYLPRQAVTIKSLLAAEYTILISATPQLDNISCIDIYAYLMGASSYPISRSLHDLARSPGLVKMVESYVVPEESKIKARNLLLQHHVVTTGAKLSLEICEIVYKFQESYLFRNDPYWRNVLMSTLSVNTRDYVIQPVFQSFVDRCRKAIVDDYARLANPTKMNLHLYNKHLGYVQVDSSDHSRLGTIIVSENDGVDKMNAYGVDASLAPIHAALVRLIAWLVDEKQAKFLIYDAASKSAKNTFWERPKEILKRVHSIDLLQFGGPMTHLNRKRKLLVDESRTGLFLPDNHIDGTNFPEVTHVIVVGEVRDQAKYEQFIGRGKRRGRVGPLTIVKLQAVEADLCLPVVNFNQ
jgi:hypothetical protein